jgi:hypothetical protein
MARFPTQESKRYATPWLTAPATAGRSPGDNRLKAHCAGITIKKAADP